MIDLQEHIAEIFTVSADHSENLSLRRGCAWTFNEPSIGDAFLDGDDAQRDRIREEHREKAARARQAAAGRRVDYEAAKARFPRLATCPDPVLVRARLEGEAVDLLARRLGVSRRGLYRQLHRSGLCRSYTKRVTV